MLKIIPVYKLQYDLCTCLRKQPFKMYTIRVFNMFTARPFYTFQIIRNPFVRSSERIATLHKDYFSEHIGKLGVGSFPKRTNKTHK